ncbi:hypothetical protein CPB84DRAFT_292185 [Gymnopilus junonius]|uniref:Uncharacterized protein n=1 Tax=Gymnopilus junonius TaxID=109634 RepID=A0A9P5THV7_GYMJU|nr:hypothetical protein CPB84DRAFT_292185 [Gymnopilus junonius]
MHKVTVSLCFVIDFHYVSQLIPCRHRKMAFITGPERADNGHSKVAPQSPGQIFNRHCLFVEIRPNFAWFSGPTTIEFCIFICEQIPDLLQRTVPRVHRNETLIGDAIELEGLPIARNELNVDTVPIAIGSNNRMDHDRKKVCLSTTGCTLYPWHSLTVSGP